MKQEKIVELLEITLKNGTVVKPDKYECLIDCGKTIELWRQTPTGDNYRLKRWITSRHIVWQKHTLTGS